MIWNLKLATVAVIAIGIASAGGAWYAYSKGRESGMTQVQAMWDAERLATMTAHAEEQIKARQREEALKVLLARQRKEHKREVDRIIADYNADLERLRDRPAERAGAGGVPEGAAAGVGCTGEGLSRPDSEFLVWLGGEAARTQAALNACVTAYDEVRRSINQANEPSQ
jgi:hypothetical protein